MATRFTCLKAHPRTSPLKTQTDSASIITSETLGIPVCRLASSFHEEGMDMDSAEMEKSGKESKKDRKEWNFSSCRSRNEWYGMERNGKFFFEESEKDEKE